MARIELKNTPIYIEDGLSGSAGVSSGGSSGSATLGVTTVVLNTDVTDQIPVGGRFTISGESTPTVHTVMSRTPSSGPTTSIGIAPALGAGSYNAPAELGAVTVSQEGDVSNDEIQSIAVFGNTVTGGTYTLTLNLNGAGPITTAPIAYDANAGTIETAIDVAVTAATYPSWTNGDIAVTGGPLTTDPVVLTYSGTSVEETNHGTVEITSVSLVTSTGNAVLTFMPQQIEVKIGDGDISWTESREFNYDLDRGRLDTVRQGDEQPVSVDLQFVYEYVTAQSGRPITPVDALKRIGEATEWVSSDPDQCAPFAVNIVVIHCVPCGTDYKEKITFPDFRWESLEFSIDDAAISVSGQCNTTEAIAERAASYPECSA